MEEIGNLFLLTREAAGVSLKEYISNYAKYLGLDSDKIIDEFNEYVFESTSKIPVKEIEKQIEENKKNEEEKVISPYTRKEKKIKGGLWIVLYIIFLFLFACATFWSVKQITINSKIANNISYNK